LPVHFLPPWAVPISRYLVFVRRLMILFALIALGGVVLIGRLAQLQLLQAQEWRDRAQSFINRHYIIETSRGAIIDRNGRALALDKACYDLAIDYRAMNLDDQWISRQASARMTAMGIKGRERKERFAQIKADIAQQIQRIPEAISQWTGVPITEI